MKLIETIKEMQSLSAAWQRDGQRIGFVPTMGNLHAGHLSLVEEARSKADKVVASIFVNPMQFDDANDFSKYPRTLDDDKAKLSELGVAAIFIPDERELYPVGKEAITRVEVPAISEILEGASRAGHFVGVTTVVNKLFNIVTPDVALFGEKDFQQLLILQRMVADLNMPVRIIGLPTSREADGLAMSSRNTRLTAEQRHVAPVLYQSLQEIRQELLTANNDFTALQQRAFAQLSQAGFQPDYIELRDANTLLEPDPDCQERVVLAAASLGEIRLIDNLRI
jgi:pantoate--beta-alanine ligase